MRFHAIKADTGTGPSGAMEVGPRNAVQVLGIVAGDEVEVEESIDGENWETVGSTITTDGIVDLDIDTEIMRANKTANAGGGEVDVWLSNGIREW